MSSGTDTASIKAEGPRIVVAEESVILDDTLDDILEGGKMPLSPCKTVKLQDGSSASPPFPVPLRAELLCQESVVLCPGDRVRVVGLVTHAGLNGLLGQVIRRA